MEFLKIYRDELEHEANTSRKILERIPDDKFSWQPHEKSMTIKRLATHIADLHSWPHFALAADELDFANTDYKEPDLNSTADLLRYLEESVEKGKSLLTPEYEASLMDPWTLRNGEQIYHTDPRHTVLRMAMNQIVHHRAQMGVYLRLLNIPIPGSYGPSADETTM